MRDSDPIDGVGYYRLKQVDFDGKQSESEIISSECSSADGWIELYPNPTAINSTLIVHSNQVEPALIFVLDDMGRAIVSSSVSLEEGVGNIELSATELKPGVYNVVVELNDKKVSKKWVIMD